MAATVVLACDSRIAASKSQSGPQRAVPTRESGNMPVIPPRVYDIPKMKPKDAPKPKPKGGK